MRVAVEDGQTWFPVLDITYWSRDGDKLHAAATRWLKNNISENGIRRIKFDRTVGQRAGNLLCVNSDNVALVGMYEAHIRSKKDFRAKWADLPDTPAFTTEATKELCWRNIYKWSKAEHNKRLGAHAKLISGMRVLLHQLADKTGAQFPERTYSYAEAVKILGSSK